MRKHRVRGSRLNNTTTPKMRSSKPMSGVTSTAKHRAQARVSTGEEHCVSVITTPITRSSIAHVMRKVNPHHWGFLGDSFTLETPVNSSVNYIFLNLPPNHHISLITLQNKSVLDMLYINFDVYRFLRFVVIFFRIFWAFYDAFCAYRCSTTLRPMWKRCPPSRWLKLRLWTMSMCHNAWVCDRGSPLRSHVTSWSTLMVWTNLSLTQVKRKEIATSV